MSNPLCHFDFLSGDTEKFKAFYGSVFGWKFDDDSMPGYSLINAGAEPTGGVAKMPEGSPAACINVYFQVDDIDTTLKKAEKLGSKVLVPKTQIPNVGHIALFADPEGIPIGILQPG